MISDRLPSSPDSVARVGRWHVPTWVFFLVGGAIWLGAAAYEVRYGQGWFLDLRVYRAAGQALYDGKPVYSLLFTRNHLPFTYPPFALLILSPLSLGPVGLMKAFWWSLNVAALVSALTIALRSATGLRGARSVAVASVLAGLSIALEPVRSNMNYAQVNWLLMLVVLWDLTRSDSRWRGVPLGIAAAVKLTPLVFVLFLLIRRDWKAAARAVGTFAAATLVSWAILPAASTRYWFHLVFEVNRIGGLANVSNQSWDGLLERPPFAHLAATKPIWGVLAVATVIAAGFLGSSLLADGRRLQAIFVVALCELLISPVSWTHHWSWLALAPVLLPDLWRRRRASAVMVGLLLATAVAAPYLWSAGPAADLMTDSLVLAGAATLAVWLVGERRGRIRPGARRATLLPPPTAEQSPQLECPRAEQRQH